MNNSADSVEVVHPYVECREGVQGGRPVIRGTRFPVSSIIRNHRRGLAVEEILREFPHLTASQVYDALSFYHDHREQVDRELEELEDVQAAMTRYPPTQWPSDGDR